jgi:hypothetical protein
MVDRPTLPTAGSTGWATTLNDGINFVSDKADMISSGGFYLDSPRYTGTDDARLTSAIADQQASGGTNMPPIILPNRPLSFTTPRTLYSGLKVIGAFRSGQKNPELASGNYVGPEITLGGTITSGTASWWNGTGSIYDVFMSDFAVQGSSGASTHQFLDHPVSGGTLYACEFRSLSFNFMRAVFGRKDRQAGFTQVNLTGVWTMNNLWDSQLTVGGSDNSLWMGGYVNIGPSASSAQTGTYAGNSYQMNFQSMTNTNVGYIYCSALNGWRGIRVTGTSSVMSFYGGVYEGYKPTRVNGLLSGPAPGTVIRIDDGACMFYGTHIGQGMDNPDVAEDGLVQINGGEVTMIGCNFYGQNMATANAIDHNGGRLSVLGSTKRLNESATWSNRPKVSTTATAGSGTYTYYCPDSSMA